MHAWGSEPAVVIICREKCYSLVPYRVKPATSSSWFHYKALVYRMARGIRIDRSGIIAISGDSVRIVLSGYVDTASVVSVSRAGSETITV